MAARRSVGREVQPAAEAGSPNSARTGLVSHQLSERFADSSASSVLSKIIRTPSARRWERDSDLGKLGGHDDKGSKDYWRNTLLLAYTSIGIVYGDVGTSPLYVMASVFSDTPTKEEIVGVTSLILWSITALLGIKYALIVLRADDNGQGGAFALYSLLKRQGTVLQNKPATQLDAQVAQYSVGPRSSQARGSGISNPRSSMPASAQPGTPKAPVASPSTQPTGWRQSIIQAPWMQRCLKYAVVCGVGMIFGDGCLTPSISVVSAFEGLQVRWPETSRGAIDGAAIGVLVLLFGIQRFGTAKVGNLFSPIIIIWLLANAVIGVYNIAKYDVGIFRAIGPNYWFNFFLTNKEQAWRQLGGVLLCFTGVEALFADLGHFSRASIQMSTFTLLLPSLWLTYLGQGAYLTAHPDQVATTFWSALPNGTFYPMFIVATLAAIIASQALISAVFQIIAQAIKQGFLPRFAILHTSRKHAGQLYVPFMNWLLMVLCILVVATFQTSAKLGRAYGLAVICDMILTTHFMTLVIITVWRLPLVLAAAFYLVFFAIEATFLSSTATKVPTGGWFTLLVASCWAVSMLLWNWGTNQKGAFFRKDADTALDGYIAVKGSSAEDAAKPAFLLKGSGQALANVPGMAMYYSDKTVGIPPVLKKHMAAFPALHAVNFFVTNRVLPVPTVAAHERFLMQHLGLPGFYAVVARYGYLDTIKQGPEHAHTIKEHVLVMLYNSLQGALDRNGQVLEQLKLDYKPGDNGGTVPMSTPPTIEEEGSAQVAITMPSTAQGFDGVEWGTEGRAIVSPFASQAGGVSARASFMPTHDAATGAPVLSPQARFTLEKVVKDLVAIPLGQSGVSVEQRSAFHLLWLMAAEINILAGALENRKAVYVLGTANPRLNTAANIFRRYLLELPYQIMAKNLQADADRAFAIPADQLLKVELPFTL